MADVLTFDPDLPEEEKERIVNERIAEIAREHPSCKITTEYARTTPMEDTSTGEVYHLLWSSDRLEIAREVDSRITQIYADLVSLEKMMHYKRSIIDVLPVACEAGERRKDHETGLADNHSAACTPA